MGESTMDEKLRYGAVQGNDVCEKATPGTQSVVMEAERHAMHFAEQAHKAAQGYEFLKAHPEFGEFIQLIRKCAIKI